VYFYTELKKFDIKFLNCPFLAEATHELPSTKINAIIHNQLQAPIHSNMIKYAWYAAKLISHEVFGSVNQASFPDGVKTAKCECSKMAFIQCSCCCKFLFCNCFRTNPIPGPAILSLLPDMLQTLEDFLVTVKS